MTDNEYQEDDLETEDYEIDLSGIDQLAEQVAEGLMQNFDEFVWLST